MSTLPRSRREEGEALARVLDADAHRVREAFQSRDERRYREYSIKGRHTAAGVRWDIFGLRDTGLPVFIIGGFHWQEEAVIHCRDLLHGKVAVSFGGARAIFGRGLLNGVVAAPQTGLDRAGGGGGMVYTRNAPDGSLIASAQPPTVPKLVVVKE